jgi:hypothetical protein
MFGLLDVSGSWFARAAFSIVAALSMPSVGLAGENTAPAVSGPNGKFSIEGGQYDNSNAFLALGSFTAPLSHNIGLQIDGAFGQIDSKQLDGGGIHLFARDPSNYLFGIYGSYHEWNDIRIVRTAAEVEFYLNRFSVIGLAGYERVDVPNVSAGLPVLNKDSDHFFGEASLA